MLSVRRGAGEEVGEASFKCRGHRLSIAAVQVCGGRLRLTFASSPSLLTTLPLLSLFLAAFRPQHPPSPLHCHSQPSPIVPVPLSSPKHPPVSSAATLDRLLVVPHPSRRHAAASITLPSNASVAARRAEEAGLFTSALAPPLVSSSATPLPHRVSPLFHLPSPTFDNLSSGHLRIRLTRLPPSPVEDLDPPAPPTPPSSPRAYSPWRSAGLSESRSHSAEPQPSLPCPTLHSAPRPHSAPLRPDRLTHSCKGWPATTRADIRAGHWQRDPFSGWRDAGPPVGCSDSSRRQEREGAYGQGSGTGDEVASVLGHDGACGAALRHSAALQHIVRSACSGVTCQPLAPFPLCSGGSAPPAPSCSVQYGTTDGKRGPRRRPVPVPVGGGGGGCDDRSERWDFMKIVGFKCAVPRRRWTADKQSTVHCFAVPPTCRLLRCSHSSSLPPSAHNFIPPVSAVVLNHLSPIPFLSLHLHAAASSATTVVLLLVVRFVLIVAMPLPPTLSRLPRLSPPNEQRRSVSSR